MDAVFFGNSGAEANEGAIKAARKYSTDTYGAARNKVITLVNSFHGRTLATPDRHRPGCVPPVFRIRSPATLPMYPPVIFPPCGMLPTTPSAPSCWSWSREKAAWWRWMPTTWPRWPSSAKKRDLVLIVDEVQTGVGRTGKFLACEHFDLHPDIVTLAKGLGGGLPIGAVLMTAKVAEHMGPGTHGSTFGGNPVVCAGALAVLDAMDEAFMDNVLTQAARLRTGLKTLPHVTEVSGLGLMVGIAFEDGIKAADVRAACEKEGLLVLTAKTRLRLLPPLILTETDVDTALDTLRTVLEKF